MDILKTKKKTQKEADVWVWLLVNAGEKVADGIRFRCEVTHLPPEYLGYVVNGKI